MLQPPITGGILNLTALQGTHPLSLDNLDAEIWSVKRDKGKEADMKRDDRI